MGGKLFNADHQKILRTTIMRSRIHGPSVRPRVTNTSRRIAAPFYRKQTTDWSFKRHGPCHGPSGIALKDELLMQLSDKFLLRALSPNRPRVVDVRELHPGLARGFLKGDREAARLRVRSVRLWVRCGGCELHRRLEGLGQQQRALLGI